ncbi:MAG: insulinase family protein [Flaviaesturariibacter sp.]|nr:insulinase family protein [Flaviaesturariibacter sp.]
MTNTFKTSFLALLLLLASTVAQAQGHSWKKATAGGYTYSYVTGDPMNTRFYTLKNGLTVILSPNKKEPRISFRMPVRTGSNNDPKDHTGLAHYLEHVLFKGTDKYGTLDWAKEKPLLDRIDALYEQYNSTTDPDRRRAIYHQIDSVSGLASKYSIANEYDKLMAALGSQSSNAHTWVEETVYEEDIPSNAVDKFLSVQAERFRNPIFRIFHTELEAVYEEKNRGLDNDGTKMSEALHAALFPTHNYGQQTTIGTIEHLKNPSLKAIRAYYHQYYVPNNMAVVMAGDFDPDALIKKIDKAFAYMKPAPVAEYKGPREQPITAPIIRDIYGPSAETMRIAYRVGPANSHDADLAELVSSILSNGKAGLLDLNLNKLQKVQGAGAGVQQYKDYGIFQVVGSPKSGQTLEEVKDLLLGQIALLKSGSFDESLLKAIIANYKLGQLQALENNTARVETIDEEFIKNKGADWNEQVAFLDELGKITKKEVVDFANRFFGDNYAVLYKRKGEDKNIVKVDKPAITAVETNAGKQSPFVAAITGSPLPSIKPVWVDFNKDLQKGKAGPAEVLYVPNKDNSLFRLYHHFDIGSYNDKLLPVALQYLQFLGTDKYTAEDISKQFYNLAANFTAAAGAEETNVTISGLQENFKQAVSLFENLITNCKPNAEALEALKQRLMKTRANNKLNKGVIASGLRSYAIYGEHNPFNYVLSDAEIANLTADQLVTILHGLMGYQHSVLYYGPASLSSLGSTIQQLHRFPANWTPAPPAVHFERIRQAANQVLFADYNAVQAEIYWSRTMNGYDPRLDATVDLFNNYFGGGMGSIVFQTIRESKALAYSTFASVQSPSKKNDPYSFIGYVGSQADKMNDAIAGMNELINTLPAAQQNFENARTSLAKDIETQRITKDAIIFSYLAAKKLGVSEDRRKAEYDALKKLTLQDLVDYHKNQLSRQPYTYSIVASEKNIKLDDLKKYGELRVLTLPEIFGY